jgi:hypothetical protein
VAGYRHNYREAGKILRLPGVGAAVGAYANRVEVRARVTALRRTTAYADSISSHVELRHDRLVGVVLAGDRASLSIEFGTRNTPKHLTLTAALLEGARRI